MIGDHLYIDIALGHAGIKTVLVLCGETKAENLQDSEFQPDAVVQDLAEFVGILELSKQEKKI